MKSRNVYLEKLNTQIEQYNTRLVGVGDAANEAQADAIRLDYMSRVKQLEGKIRETWNTISESSWECMKGGE